MTLAPGRGLCDGSLSNVCDRVCCLLDPSNITRQAPGCGFCWRLFVPSFEIVRCPSCKEAFTKTDDNICPHCGANVTVHRAVRAVFAVVAVVIVGVVLGVVFFAPRTSPHRSSGYYATDRPTQAPAGSWSTSPTSTSTPSSSSTRSTGYSDRVRSVRSGSSGTGRRASSSGGFGAGK